MLLPMVDGGILNINYDSDYYQGCATCDYGSSYVREFNVKLTTINIHIRTSQEYEYAISEDFMMKTFLQNVDVIKNMTELEFYQWLEEVVRAEAGYALDYVRYYEV